jgi:hypothetical protein
VFGNAEQSGGKVVTARVVHRTIATLVMWLTVYSTELATAVLCLRWFAARYLPLAVFAHPSRWRGRVKDWGRSTATALAPPMWLPAASAKI